MRSTTPRDLTGHCPRCVLKIEICVCQILPQIETQTEFVMVQHVTEQLLTSNTGRFAALSLPNSRLLHYGGGEPFDAGLISGPGTALLYCSGAARSLSFVPRRLGCAGRKLSPSAPHVRASARLRELPELTLPAPRVMPTRSVSRPMRKACRRSKPSQRPFVARRAGTAAPLWALHGELVRRADQMRGQETRTGALRALNNRPHHGPCADSGDGPSPASRTAAGRPGQSKFLQQRRDNRQRMRYEPALKA